MAYTPNFTPTYENGWEDLPSENTPITADALNNYDEAIEYIEDYLEQGGGGGADTSIIAEEYDESESYSEGQYVIYEDKLYKCVTDTFGGEFDPSDWSEITVSSEMYSEFSTINDALGRRVPVDNVGYVNSDLNRAEKAYTQGEIFYMEYGQRVAVALTNISLGDSLVLHTNYEYTTLSEQIANSGGGGGSSTLAGLSDVNLSSPTDGQVLKYDATNDEWVNANESGGGGGSTVTITPTLQSGTKIADYSINGVSGELYAPTGGGGGSSDNYSTTETAIGTWVDGRTIYRKCFTLGSISAPNPGNWCTLSGVSITDLDMIIKGFGYLSTTKVAKIYGWKNNNGTVQCIYHTGDFKPASGEIICVDYVKTI